MEAAVGGYPTGVNSYYHESGWNVGEIYRNNYDSLNIDLSKYIANTFNQEIVEADWTTVGDYGGTGGQGYTISTSVSGCEIELLESEDGSDGYTRKYTIWKNW